MPGRLSVTGDEQLHWLKRELAASAEAGERAIVLSHVVLSPEAALRSINSY